MRELLQTLLTATITAAVPVITVYGISLIRKVSAGFSAKTDSLMMQGIIQEVSSAVCDGVSAVNQTYVDSLKKSGAFTKEAQKEAAEEALEACMAAISAETQEFLENKYGDLAGYLRNKIEAEVRNQKFFICTQAEEIADKPA